jgi:hypothetical protein
MLKAKCLIWLMEICFSSDLHGECRKICEKSRQIPTKESFRGRKISQPRGNEGKNFFLFAKFDFWYFHASKVIFLVCESSRAYVYANQFLTSQLIFFEQSRREGGGERWKRENKCVA